MSIENDIQQFTFKSSRQKALINILYTYGWIMERIRGFLADEGITHQQYNILRILRGSHPTPLSTLQIRERMLDKMSDTSRLVDRLVAKELVQKRTCPKDKRLVDVTITEKGQALLKKLDAKIAVEDTIMQHMSDEDAQTLSDLLDRVRNNHSEPC